MRVCWSKCANKGFTLIELMVVLSVIGVVLALAAPSFGKMIDMQRLRGVSDQFTTDVQFTRSEAASRQGVTGMSFKAAAGMTCYTVHTCGSRSPANCACDCTAAAGSRCPAVTAADPTPPLEIRTVQLTSESRVRLDPVRVTGATGIADRITFDPATGGLSYHFVVAAVAPTPPPSGEFWALAKLLGAGAQPSLRTEISATGRPQVCSPSSTVTGVPAC